MLSDTEPPPTQSCASSNRQGIRMGLGLGLLLQEQEAAKKQSAEAA